MRWLLTVAILGVATACHSTYAHGEAPTPSSGTIQPAALYYGVNADGVTSNVTVTDAYVGATYAGATTAFLLQATISVDGVALPPVAAQYQLSLGNPGSGTYNTIFLTSIGVLAPGTHTVSITIASPQDFVGTNDGAATLSVVIAPSAPG